MSSNELIFEEFVDILFSRKREEERMYGPFDETPDLLVVSHMQHFLTKPQIVLGEYSDDEIANGIFEFVDVGYSELSERLLADSISIHSQRRTVYLMRNIYSELFARLAPAEPPSPEHEDLEGGQIGLICHMFWDSFRYRIEEEHAYLVDTVFSTLESITELPNYSCQFGALHGIGHFAKHNPDSAKRCVERFLAAPNSFPELHAYARAASEGLVL